MRVYSGTGVYSGIAMGRLAVYQKRRRPVRGGQTKDRDFQWRRFQEAKEASVRQLGELYRSACRKVGKEKAAVFEIHQMLLKDEGYNAAVKKEIREKQVSAEGAVASACEQVSQLFASMDDAYMRERAADIRDISERVLDNLSGAGVPVPIGKEPVILLAEELTPSEVIQLDCSQVSALVTTGGSSGSHAAILARSMGLPMIVGASLSLDETMNGKMAVADGTQGRLYVEPDEETLNRMRRRQKEQDEQRKQLLALKGKETITRDGRKIELYANIGSRRDLQAALENDAGGIGLFRTEFLYLNQETYPSEEEQFAVYKEAAEAMAGKPVMIRTLDIGADKQCPCFQLNPEENPALGYRGIRISLDRPDVFKTQLRALFRAGAYGQLAILYPMIASIWEIREIRAIADEVRKELTAENIRIGIPRQGIMIETPAAALISAELAKEADFFSIGTNDLTQYTLAADRQNSRLDRFYDPSHPAVLALIRMAIENAHKAGIRADICGELAAQPSMAQTLLDMGADGLSVAPGSILPVRKAIRELCL